MNSKLRKSKNLINTKEKKYLDIFQKYKRFFERNDKDELINKIKCELKNDFNDIDIEIIAENIFEFCCLIVANININEISSYILEKNNYTFNLLSKEEKKFYNNGTMLKKISLITDKYIKKITPYS